MIFLYTKKVINELIQILVKVHCIDYFACLKKINDFFQKSFFLTALLTIGLPILWSIHIDEINEKERLKSIEFAFSAEGCLNVDVARILETGKDGEMYVFNVSYRPSFVRENWADLNKIMKQKDMDRSLLFQAVATMENQNMLLANSAYLPSATLANGATGLKQILNELGFNSTVDSCTSEKFRVN